MVVIAVEGCCHGELDSIYASLALAEQRAGVKVDVLLICGDFQAVRNAADLAGMACPPKYRAMHDFYKYYSGEKVAPVLTIFIGGNHEASAHLSSLAHGGWAAPNIYYLGFAGVVRVCGLRIGGLTGIFNGRHYKCGHYEVPPFNDDDMRSFYHVRELDVLRLMQLRQPMDIFLSHDWPQHIARHGDTAHLVRRKAFLKKEIDDGSLGSPPAMQLLQHLQPRYWFSAHLHVKFAAVVNHPSGRHTRFLALSKCLPEQDFLQLLEVEPAAGGGEGATAPQDGIPTIEYDAEWVAVLRSTQHLHSAMRGRLPLDPASLARASNGRTDFTPTDEEIRAVREFAAGAVVRTTAEAPVGVLSATMADAAAAEGFAPGGCMDVGEATGGETGNGGTGGDGGTAGEGGEGGSTSVMAVPLNFVISAPAYREGEPIVALQQAFVESDQTAAFVGRFGLAANFRTQRGATLEAGASSGGVPQSPQQGNAAVKVLPPPRVPQPPQPPHPGYFYGDPAGYGAPPPAYGSAPPSAGGGPYQPPPFGCAPPPPHMIPPPPQHFYAPPPPPPGPPPPHQLADGDLFTPMPLDEEIDLDDD